VKFNPGKELNSIKTEPVRVNQEILDKRKCYES